MRFYFEIMGLTGALPCAVSVCVALGCRRIGSKSGIPYAGAMAFAMAFFVAWFSLPWIPWTVNSAWQWLPWLIILSTVVFSNAAAADVHWGQWLVTVLVIATVCAFVIVPDWEDMQPARSVAISIVVATCVLQVVACQHLTNRLQPGVLCGLLIVCGIGSCALLGLAGSLKFVQLGGAMTASTIGCLVVSWKTSDRSAIRTLLPVYLISLTCLIYTGSANSFAGIPPVAFLLVAIALCAVNLRMLPMLPRLTGYRSAILDFALVGLPLLAGLLIAFQSAG